jgi:phosphoserine phosphatase RsbU/P
MPSHWLHIRLWLERNGVYPHGRLALLTCYLFTLDLVLFVVQKTAEAFHRRFGAFLSGWVIFLSLVVVVLLIVLTARRVSGKLLWRLRNRLVVTYIFIGVIPLVLLITLALGVFYLFAGQFATYVATSRLNAEVARLRASGETLATSIAGTMQNREAAISTTPQPGNDIAFSGWLNGQPIFGPVDTREYPRWATRDFSGLVRDDGGKIYLRSITQLDTAKGKLTILASTPLDSRTLNTVAAGLGEISLGELERNTGRLVPKEVVGAIPGAQGAIDVQVPSGTHLPTIDWKTGAKADDAGLAVATRFEVLYDYLFSGLGEVGASIEVLLLIVALILGLFEIMAAYIGTRLTRTVTGSVAQLYLATTYVNRGDFSHRVPISSTDQLATLAASFNLMTESIEKLVLEQKEKQRLQNEITIAQEVQNQLFPRRLSQVSNLEVHGFCRPARSVSGDYYDFLSLGSDRLILAVGDVSGKGISAALLMATIHSAVRAYSLEGVPVFRHMEAVGAGGAFSAKYDQIVPGVEVSPGTMLSLLNHQLYHSTPMEKYATLFLAMYEGERRRLTYSNAGHLPPLLLGQNGECRKLDCGGTVVGLFDDMNYDEGTVQLRPGELFLAYSDGVTEPENEFGEFGEQRLLDLVQENRDLPLARISEIVTSAVDDWIGAAEQPDDVTLVLARAR